MAMTIPNQASKHRKHQIATLQAGRGLACLIIMLYHNVGNYFPFGGNDPLTLFFRFGPSGLLFFFVLSGHIITHVHWDDLGQPRQALMYIRKRFLRIYPFYWVILSGMVALYALLPAFGKPSDRDAWNIISSYSLFLPTPMTPVVPVAWTLFHEILFYSVFALCILHKRIGLSVLIMWIAGSLLSIVDADPDFYVNFYFSRYHLMFGMGMLVCLQLRYDYFKINGFLFAFAGCLIFAVSAMDDDYFAYLNLVAHDLLYGLGSAFAILGFVTLEQAGRLHISRPLIVMGDASYCMYLTHWPLFSLMVKIAGFSHLANYLPVEAIYGVTSVIVVLLGVALHFWLEKPSIAVARLIFRKAVALGGYLGRPAG